MRTSELLSGTRFKQEQLLERQSVSLDGMLVFTGHCSWKHPMVQAFNTAARCEQRFEIIGPKLGSRTWYLFEVAPNDYLISMYQPPNDNKFVFGRMNRRKQQIHVQSDIMRTQNSADRLFVGGAQWGEEVFIFHQVYTEVYGTCHELHRISCAQDSYDTHVLTHLPVGPLAVAAINDQLIIISEDDHENEAITSCICLNIDDYKLSVAQLEPDARMGYPRGHHHQMDVCRGLLYLLLIPDKSMPDYVAGHQLWMLDVDWFTWTFVGRLPYTDDMDHYLRFSMSREGELLAFRPSTVYVREPQLFASYLHVPTLRHCASVALARANKL